LTLLVATALVGTATPGSWAEEASPGHRGDPAAVVGGTGEVRVTRDAEGADAPAPADRTPHHYVVQMSSDPVVTYDGGLRGLPATKSGPGNRVEPGSTRVRAYASHLRDEQRTALASVGGAKALYHYVYSFNGFAASLTGEQADDLRRRPDVVSVTRDEPREVDTSSTPHFLGLDGDDGLWQRLGGPAGDLATDGAGEDVVIGIIDSGIWPESASFADTGPDGQAVYGAAPDGFTGACASAETVGDDSWADDCNNKLVAARYYNAGWGTDTLSGDEAVRQQLPWESLSPRDYNGHGTHTASTAGGNHGVEVTGPAAIFGPISGIAPRARIAAYKALWSTEDGSTATGFPSDLVAAIDEAVADGVDVINYSVSGSTNDLIDPVEVAFLNAAADGVFVAASAGNSGPTAATVAHPGPWLTTVAAGTHDRTSTGAVTLGDGTRYTGVSVTATGAGPAPLITGGKAVASGVPTARGVRCYSTADNGGTPALDPAKVAGKIVLCERGGDFARVNASKAVAEAGGVGMIFVNAFENSLNADFHSVPTVHLPDTDGTAISTYAATSGATATIEPATIETGGEAPYTADFSSRGPLVAGNGDIIKPDVIAPGQDILAAVSPPGQNGMDFNLMSGTSMSAPHVAGVAALLQDLHPDWSPMMVKSALMTTGYDVLDAEPDQAESVFKQGAGHIAPTSAADPGLVYDSGEADWLAFLCGSTNGVRADVCADLESAGHSLEAGDLNTPSIGIGMIDGTKTVTRTVTNVGDRAATYTASTSGLPGVDVVVNPSTLTLQPGSSASFTVTFTVQDSELLNYLAGQLTWTDGTHRVRSPIVLRARQPGQEDWVSRYDGGSGQWGNSVDAGTALEISPDGDRLYLSGFAQPGSAGGIVRDLVTGAYDPQTGKPLWEAQWDGSNGGTDEPGGFAMSRDGETVYVGGISGGDALVIAYDGATGNELWQTRRDGPGRASDTIQDLVLSPDGSTIYVTGYSTMSEAQLDYATAAYDAATGEQLWVTYFDDVVQGTDDARAIAVSEDGKTLVVTGQSSSGSWDEVGLTSWATVAYDAGSGEQRWAVYRDGSDSPDIGEHVVIAGDHAIVSGALSATDRQTDWSTVAYDLATGEVSWHVENGGPGTDVPRGIVATPDGATVVVTGNVDGANGMDFATVAYDAATGEERWQTGHDGSGHGTDIPWDLTLTADATRVVVAGESTDAMTGLDYRSIAYDMTSGEELWFGSYDATNSSDGALGVAVDETPDGANRVFVTGESTIGFDQQFGLDANIDIATVSYLDTFESGSLRKSTTTLEPDRGSYAVGDTATVVVDVTSTRVAPTGTVTLTATGGVTKVAEVVDGSATFRLGPFTTAGTVAVTASYSGSDRTAPSRADASLSVVPVEDAAGPAVKVVRTKLVGHRRVGVRLSCVSEVACLGTAAIRKGEVKLAAGGFSVKGGTKRTVRLTLTKRGTRELRRHEVTRAVLVVRLRDGATQKVRVTLTR
jgi:subtilisin family serine protease